MATIFREGDILVMKKPHPCGGDRFLCVRCGSDVRIVCERCGRDVTVPREKLTRSIKSVLSADGEVRDSDTEAKA